MAIFHHQDCDGDAIELLAEVDDLQEDLVLLFSNRTGQRAGGVRIDRDAALYLYAALGEWLYPAHTPEGPNRSLIEQMIERAVKDQVTAVLPLHLAPFAAQMQAAEDKIGRVADALMPVDPEPHEVGHPTYEDARPYAPEPEPVSWGICLKPEETADHGRLMAELPRRAPRCTGCDHAWADHTTGVCWEKDHEGDGCRCTQVRP